MADEKALELRSATDLAELSHLQKLSQDFRQKAESVYNNLPPEFLQNENGVEIIMPVKDEKGRQDKFKTPASRMFINTLAQCIEEGPETSANGKEYTYKIMNALSGLAKLFPGQIPELFKDYAVNKNSLMPDGSYYPDGNIEAWQANDEKIITSVLEAAREGKDYPKTWAELKALYGTQDI